MKGSLEIWLKRNEKWLKKGKKDEIIEKKQEDVIQPITTNTEMLNRMNSQKIEKENKMLEDWRNKLEEANEVITKIIPVKEVIRPADISECESEGVCENERRNETKTNKKRKKQRKKQRKKKNIH